MTLRKRRSYTKMEIEEPYIKKKPAFDLEAYRLKAFAKPEKQADEYYEGFDNCVRSAVRI